MEWASLFKRRIISMGIVEWSSSGISSYKCCCSLVVVLMEVDVTVYAVVWSWRCNVSRLWVALRCSFSFCNFVYVLSFVVNIRCVCCIRLFKSRISLLNVCEWSINDAFFILYLVNYFCNPFTRSSCFLLLSSIYLSIIIFPYSLYLSLYNLIPNCQHS